MELLVPGSCGKFLAAIGQRDAVPIHEYDKACCEGRWSRVQGVVAALMPGDAVVFSFSFTSSPCHPVTLYLRVGTLESRQLYSLEAYTWVPY
jgi:hypothetical protein